MYRSLSWSSDISPSSIFRPLPRLSSVATLPLLPLLRLLLRLLLLLPLSLLLRRLTSSLPSNAFSSRLFLGPISPFSSNTSRFANRGRIKSHTRSSVKSLSTSSSMYVSSYPPIISPFSFSSNS